MRREKTLDAEGQPAPERIFAQGEMCDAKLNGVELRKESARIAAAVSVGIRAFGAVRAMMREVARAQVRPTRAQEIFVMERPDFRLLVAAQARELFVVRGLSVRRPMTGATEYAEQDARAPPHAAARAGVGDGAGV